MMYQEDCRNEWFAIGNHIRIKRGGYDHHAIIVGWGGASAGSPGIMVIDNAKVWGVALRELAGVVGGDPIEVVEHPRSDEHAREIVERAYSMIGSRYALLNWNCESFCNWCVHGVARSRQVETGVLITLALTAFALSVDDRKRRR